MNLKLDFQNSEWRIQYGGRQVEKSISFSGTLYTEIFEIADYESEIQFLKFKMANAIW